MLQMKKIKDLISRDPMASRSLFYSLLAIGSRDPFFLHPLPADSK